MAIQTYNLGVITAYGDAVAGGYTGTKAEWQALMASYGIVGQQAAQSAQTATAKAGEASTSAAMAEEAKTAAETAQANAEAAAQSINVDATLTIEDSPADAKATGDTIRNVYITDTIADTVVYVEDGADNVLMKSAKINIVPIQSGTGDPSPSNIRPISGRNTVRLTRTGKNLCAGFANGSNTYETGLTFTFSNKHHVVVTGTTNVANATSPNKTIGGSDETPIILEQGKTYTASLTGTVSVSNATNATALRLLLQSDSSIKWYGDATDGVWKITPSETFVINRIRFRITTSGTVVNINADFQIEAGETATAFEPYAGNTYNISLASAGTVYGGTLDVISGVLTVNTAILNMGSVTWSYASGTKIFYYSLSDGINPIAGGDTSALCSCYPRKTYATRSDKSFFISDTGFSSSKRIAVIDNDYTDTTTFQTAVNGQTIVYSLASPIIYNLTPIEINSLLGVNAIWSTAGNITAEYRVNTTKRIHELQDNVTDFVKLYSETESFINVWTQGTIGASTGANNNSNTRCRSNGYFTNNTLGYGTAKIYVEDGFKLNLRIWDETMTYVGPYPADWAVTEFNLPVQIGYSYRFVIAKNDDSTITPSDISDTTVRIVVDGYTDGSLKHKDTPADSIATKCAILPYTATTNARTSTILAAKTFNYADGTSPIIDWYLLADYSGDLFISKDLKSKTYITKFIRWSQYKFAIRQNGDIIAVFRNEFSDAGDNYDSSLDDIRQNPYVCLFSEGYSVWHEVDFGTAIKPTAWVENCGLCVLPNGDVIFGEYTRMMVLYSSNLWRIKAGVDITDATNWEILKTFTVAQNDTATYDESVIEHFHTVQIDPYTGTVYFATGDKGNKAQIWYSTDNGNNWVQQSFVDPSTSQTKTSGEKFFRLLNFNFTQDYVYWSSDSYSQHAVLRCTRNGVAGFAPNSITVLAEIAQTTGQAATYGTVLYPQHKIMILLERLDSTATSMQFRAFDITTNTLKTICTINSATGNSAHIGFRTEYTEFDPYDGIIRCGFGSNANYKNYNAVCGNKGVGEFEKCINNLSVIINVDADRNVFARFGCYYI